MHAQSGVNGLTPHKLGMCEWNISYWFTYLANSYMLHINRVKIIYYILSNYILPLTDARVNKNIYVAKDWNTSLYEKIQLLFNFC